MGIFAFATIPLLLGAPPDERPNIVFILADDLGMECLTTYGGKSHETPHIDRLRAQGMQFSDCYSNPFCSPSRASLLTGRYPFKNGLSDVLFSIRQENIHLSPEQPSYVRQLKSVGYATTLVGKWHMSLIHKHNTINSFGFDEYQVWQIFDDQGKKRRRFWTPHLNRNGALMTDEISDRYGPDVDLECYLDFIRRKAESKEPFFASYSTCLPHFPWEPTPDSKEQGYVAPHAEHKGDPKYFADMIAYLDKQVGLIMKALDDLGIADNTVLIFLSDNGTDRDLVNLWGDGKPVKGGKGTMTDLGTHVPLIVRWPGRIAPGSTCGDLIDFSDFFPTICEIAGAGLPDDELHGRSFLPQLLGKPGTPRQWVHVQHRNERHLRSAEYILDRQNKLRPVVQPPDDPAAPLPNKDNGKEAVARQQLNAAFKELGD